MSSFAPPAATIRPSRWTVTAETLLSAQEYTPFEGMELTGWPAVTILRGRVVLSEGEPVGEPAGGYIREALGQVDGRHAEALGR